MADATGRSDETQSPSKFACGVDCDLTEEDFITTDAADFLDLLDLLSDHHISEDSAESSLQAKKLLFQHLKEKEDFLRQRQGHRTDIRTDIIQALVEEHGKRRQTMLEIAEAFGKILQALSDERKAELKRYFPKLDETFKRIMAELNDENCPFIVAGETGSGKSQFLNLLTGHLNNEFLPVSNNPSTSCICAIKYADKESSKIKAYRADIDDFEEEDITEENMAETLSKFTNQKEHRDKILYTRVEVGCSLPWLQNGLTIYDSPGCGERAEITAMVKEMLPKAYGFIYVLNTPSGGGIKTANLEEFWATESSSTTKTPATDILPDSFDPKTAIFVFNKWDLVPQQDQAKVKEYVQTTLQDFFGDNIDLETQVFYLSATQEMAALRGGYFTKYYKRILKGIESLLQQSFRSRITKYYNYLGKVLRRCNIVLTTFLNDSSNIKKTYKELKARLTNLEHLSAEVEVDLKKALQKQTETIMASLKAHLNQDETKERLCNWDESECPLECTTWRLLKFEVCDKIQLRFRKEVKHWENESRIFEKAEDYLVITLDEKFETLRKSLFQAEGALSDKTTDDQALAKIMREMALLPVKKSMSLKKKVLLSIAAATIVGGLIIGPIYLVENILRRNREQEQEQQDWDYYNTYLGKRHDYPVMMAEKMQQVIKHNLKADVLKAAIAEQMATLTQNYLSLLDEIPRFVEADKKLLQARKHKKDRDLSNDTRQEYLMMLSQLTKLQQRIEYFYFQHIYRNEVDPADLHLDKEVGKGTFGQIWSAMLKPEDEAATAVFVKKLPVSLSEELASNALAIMMEHTRLKQIQSENVIRYYGLCLSSQQSGESPLSLPYLVMESASLTLDMVRDSDTYRGPGMLRSTRKSHTVILERMAGYLMQIANGLVKMHEEDIVHHALKPHSILVIQASDAGAEDVLKLSDFELSPPSDPSRNNSTHLPECTHSMYTAPDSRKINSKKSEDLFSFGLIGLELYYGKCLCQLEFVKLVDDGKVEFSSDPFQRNEPPPDMCDALQNCWSRDAEQRPTANYCFDVFLRYTKDWYMGEVKSSDVQEILQSCTTKQFMIFEEEAQQGDFKLCVRKKDAVTYHKVSRVVTSEGNVRYSMADRNFSDLSSMVSFYETHNLNDSTDSSLLASR